MKSVKQLAFAALLSIGALGAVTMVSCNKEDDDPITCPTGYEGADCDSLMVNKFLGTYSITEDCSVTGNVGPYTGTITPSGTNVVAILLNNFGDFENDITVNGTVNGTNLTVAEQNVGGYTISGNGTYSADGTGAGGTLTLIYSVTDSQDDTESCTATWVKQ